MKKLPETPMSTNDLAFERTILAENRTLMAWIRTAISLISFGFTIYKFFEQTTTHHLHRFLSPRKVGMIMIALGLFALSWGLVEHNLTIKKLRKSYPGLTPSRSRYLAVLILLFGITLLIFAYLRQ